MMAYSKVLLIAFVSAGLLAGASLEAFGDGTITGSMMLTNTDPEARPIAITAQIGGDTTIPWNGMVDVNGEMMPILYDVDGDALTVTIADAFTDHPGTDTLTFANFVSSPGTINPAPSHTVERTGGVAIPPPSMITLARDNIAEGNYMIAYTVSDGKGGTDATSTITITVDGTAPAADPITLNSVHPDDILIPFANYITGLDDQGETLELTFVLSDNHGLENPGGVLNYDTNAPNDFTVDTDAVRYAVTLENGLDSTRTVTGSYTISDGTDTDTATITINLAEAAAPSSRPLPLLDWPHIVPFGTDPFTVTIATSDLNDLVTNTRTLSTAELNSATLLIVGDSSHTDRPATAAFAESGGAWTLTYDYPNPSPARTETFTYHMTITDDQTSALVSGSAQVSFTTAAAATCDISIPPNTSIDFGEVQRGQISAAEPSFTIQSTGSAGVAVMLEGGAWSDGSTPSQEVMPVDATHYSQTQGTDYATMTPLSDSEASLGTIPVGDNITVYMKLQANIIDGIASDTITAPVQQTMTVSSTCA